jgi:uncharacterized cupin superfamily protein
MGLRINLLDEGNWIARTQPPEKPGYEWRRKRLASEQLGASLYELPPGQKTWPYHYELGNDELLVVISGQPTLRDPDGEQLLGPGDCVLFPTGPAGAHQIINRSAEPVRVLLVSSFTMPRGAVQPESDKLMIRWSPDAEGNLWFRRADAVDYWEGVDESS